jgi:hypothetical protein
LNVVEIRVEAFPIFGVPDEFGMMDAPGTSCSLGCKRKERTMSGMTLDATSSDRLRTVKEPIELFDHQGLPLGTFTPFDRQGLDRKVEVPYTDEEIRRLKDQQGGRTLAEILADLEKRS